MSDAMNSKLMYPDTSVLPEACRVCPALAEPLAHWQMAQAMTGSLMNLGAFGGDKSEQIIQANAESIPPEFVSFIGLMQGEDLDPSIDADRETAVRLLLSPEGPLYKGTAESITNIEDEMRDRTGHCRESGTIRVRVPSNAGNVLVRLCGADINNARPDHAHLSEVFLQREA